MNRYARKVWDLGKMPRIAARRCRSVRLRSTVIALVFGTAGCGHVTWRDYHGPQDWATGAGLSSRTKDGLIIYEGLPDHPYEVLGIVEAQGPANIFTQPAHRETMHKMIREHGGDAMILVGRELVRTGSSTAYQGQAYSQGNWAHETGSGSSSDVFHYALAVLAIRQSQSTSQPDSRQGRDPVAWARSVLAGGTAVLGSETGR
jgi:hypothetical protein